MNDIIRTEINLSEESVHKIVVAETAKAILEIPGLMETMVREVLFHRPPKQYSYDKERPTFFESVIQKTMKPMIEEEVRNQAEAHRAKLTAVIKDAFRTGVIDNKEFEDRLIDRLSKFTANIDFYIVEK